MTETATGEITTKEALESYLKKCDEVIELRTKLAKLTGHQPWCEIQVDPNWKPCTCGRG